jgi:hypothetical protein
MTNDRFDFFCLFNAFLAEQVTQLWYLTCQVIPLMGEYADSKEGMKHFQLKSGLSVQPDCKLMAPAKKKDGFEFVCFDSSSVSIRWVLG